jgi:transcriptional regulator with GAF, ATPase, and Fis domain
MNDAMTSHILSALEAGKGKIHGPGGAAEILDINPSTLRNRMNKLGIVYGRKINRLTGRRKKLGA